MRRFISLLFAIALLSSCAGSPYAESQKYERLRDYRGDGFGYAVVSVGVLKSALFTSTSLGFIELATRSPGVFGYAPKLLVGDRTPRDFDSPVQEGTIAVRRLPPGDYEITGAGGVWLAGLNRVSKSIRFTPPVSFSIVTGKVSYLGSYVVGEDGNAVSGTASLSVTDEQARDLAVASSRVPSLDRTAVRSFVRSVEIHSP